MLKEQSWRIIGFTRSLHSMIFYRSGSISNSGFWGSGDDARRIAIVVTAVAGLAIAATFLYSRRRSLKSPWSRRRQALSPQQWRSMFTPDGRLVDGGAKFLKCVRSGGIDPRIRAEVWPFLLGVVWIRRITIFIKRELLRDYEFNSSEADRKAIKTKNRNEYENLRRQICQFLKDAKSPEKSTQGSGNGNGEGHTSSKNPDSSGSEDVTSTRKSLSTEEMITGFNETNHLPPEEASKRLVEEEKKSKSCSTGEMMTDSNETDSLLPEKGSNRLLEEEEKSRSLSTEEMTTDFNETDHLLTEEASKTLVEVEEKSTITDAETSVDSNMGTSSYSKSYSFKDQSVKVKMSEDLSTWLRIIRLDAVRANAEWVPYSPTQASVPEERARSLAEEVGLTDYKHLQPFMIFHAARLVAILEAYALYDPEIGYCQGMSDLLAPIVTVMEENYEAFWCFVGFMKKARHNFRLDEVGIRRQLHIVSKIIKLKDPYLFRHLEMLQAEDCFFVYRMVVVLFRRELTFEQTGCLWEVMWADQAAIRAGIDRSAWRQIRQQAPPTDDLLLYAIAASVLQKRKLIIENYRSMDEIIRECNNMAGQLDVWKLLDDAHNLVVTLHSKI